MSQIPHLVVSYSPSFIVFITTDSIWKYSNDGWEDMGSSKI